MWMIAGTVGTLASKWPQGYVLKIQCHDSKASEDKMYEYKLVPASTIPPP